MIKTLRILSLSQLCILIQLISLALAYKTVVVVHGLNCGASGFVDVKEKIMARHPGTNVILLKYFEDWKTFDPLPGQLDLVNREMQNIMHDNPEGIHLVCHSQGKKFITCNREFLLLKMSGIAWLYIIIFDLTNARIFEQITKKKVTTGQG